MSLHGTLESFALPDVLTLIATTRKTGELRVVGDRVTGRLWLLEGRFTGWNVPKATDLVDGVFELLRLSDGEFDFAADQTAPDPQPDEDVEPVLAEAQARLAIWREIETVIPSIGCGVKLAAEAPGDTVSLRADQWTLLVSVAAAKSVQSVVERVGAGEFATCQALKELVELGLVEVGAAPAEEPAPVEVAVPAAMAPPATPAPVAPPPPPDPVVAEPTADQAPPAAEPAPAPAPAAAAPAAPAAVAAEEVAVPVAPRPKLAPSVAAPTPPPPPAATPPAAAAAPPAAPAARPGSLSSLIEGTRGASSATPQAADAVAVTANGATNGSAKGTANGSSAEAAGGPSAADADGDEAINRGLLLKFLSSVRS